MLHLKFLPPESLVKSEVQELLEPEFRQWTLRPENREDCILLAAYEEGVMAGLIAADCSENSPVAHIQSLNVNFKFQGRGIRLQLLEKLESALIKRGVSKASIEIAETQATLTLLKKAGWSRPTRLFENFLFDLRVFNPPWYENPPPLPEKFSWVSWENLSPQDQDDLQHYGEMEGILLSGKDRNFPVEPLNSYLLKCGDKIAGWMETHRLDKDTVNYSHLFIFPEWRFQGVAIPLLAKSIHTQRDKGIPIAFFELNLAETPKAWQNFIAKRLRPYANRNYFTLYSNKMLNVL